MLIVNNSVFYKQLVRGAFLKKCLMPIVLFTLFFFSKNVLSAVTITSFLSSDVGVSSVRLNATVSASAETTRIHFEYGTSPTNLVLSTPEKILTNSAVENTVDDFISNLQCGTTYYFYVVANSGGVETISNSDSFTTLGCVSVLNAIDTYDAINVTQSSARLLGNVSLAETYLEVSYYFEYGLNTTYGEKIEGGPLGQGVSQAEVNADVFGLSCSSNYHYRLVVLLKSAIGSDVEKNEGNDMVLATENCPEPILFPATAVATGRDKATISVALHTYNKEVDLFFQWGKTTELGEQTATQQVMSGTVLEQISGLSCGIPHYFIAVLQYDDVELRSDLIKFTTKACSQAPAATTEAATDILKNSASLNAKVSPNDAITSAYFQWGTDATYNLTTEVKNISAGFSGQIVKAELIDLECETKYFYRIFASNTNGQITGQSLSFTTSPCDDPITIPEPFPELESAKVFAGKNHSIILGKSGEVITWGDNRFFQLGGPTTDSDLVDGVKSTTPKGDLPPLFFNILDAAAGGEHSLILHDEGIMSFGNNNVGQLGAFTDNLPAQEPVWVVNDSGAALSQIIDVDAGNKHSIALRTDGGILVWGDNSFGQLAEDQLPKSLKPILMTSLNNAIKITAGDNFNLAILADKSLAAWGANGSGQLGVGASSQKQDVMIVPGVTNVISLSAGAEHVLALQENGSALVWGNNQNGQLGLGNTENQESPATLDFVGARVIQFAAGSNHSAALLEDGKVLAWGDNSFGQLGIGSVENVMSPTRVVGNDQEDLTGIVSIAAGNNFTIAVDNAGNILSWGDNSLGQLNGNASVEVGKVRLADKFGVNISLNMPRIIVDKESVSIERGSVGQVNVRLSANPDSVVEVKAEFEAGNDDFFIERDNRVFFSPERVDWPIEKQLTIASREEGEISEGVLSFSAPGFATVNVNVLIAGGKNEKPKEQVVGGLHPFFLIFLLSWLFFVFPARCMHYQLLSNQIFRIS